MELACSTRWDLPAQTFAAGVANWHCVICVDKPGLLADISKSISAEGVNITQASCRSIGDQKSMNTFEVGIQDLRHLHQLIKSLEKVKGVISAERVKD